MDAHPPDRPVLADPHANLETAFEDEFLRTRGYDPRRIADLSPAAAKALRAEAATYASARLAELESRAHYVHEMHGEPLPPRHGAGPKGTE